MSCQDRPFFSLIRKKISRLKQKLITNFVNQAINDRTVSQEHELSTSPFSPFVQEEDDFSTERKTDSLSVSQVINDEMMVEGNELLTSFLPPSFQKKISRLKQRLNHLLSARRSMMRLCSKQMSCQDRPFLPLFKKISQLKQTQIHLLSIK
jgi:transcriptional regulator of heat shock response